MKMNSNRFYLVVSLLCILVSKLAISQTIGIYGYDDNRWVIPNDIIHTEDGNFLIFGVAYNASQAIENYPDYQYLVKLKPNGDTIWTKYLEANWYASGRIVEDVNSYKIFSNDMYNYFCGSWSYTIPFRKTVVKEISKDGLSESIVDEITLFCGNSIKEERICKKGDIDYMVVKLDAGYNDPGGDRVAIISKSKNEISHDFNVVQDERAQYLNTLLATNDNFYLMSSRTIAKLDKDFNVLKVDSFAEDFNGDVVKAFEHGQDGIITVNVNQYSNKKTEVIHSNYSGQKIKSSLFENFATKSSIQMSSGHILLLGAIDSSIVVKVIDQNLDSIGTTSYQFDTIVSGVKIIDVDGDSFAITATLGDLRSKQQFIYIGDELSRFVTGVNEVNSDINLVIKVYPNPSEDYIVFEIGNHQDTFHAEFFDIFGRSIKKLTLKNSEKVSLDNFEIGIYFARVTSNGKNKTIRFSVK